MCELDFRTAGRRCTFGEREHNEWSLLLELCFHLEASPELTRFGDRRSRANSRELLVPVERQIPGQCIRFCEHKMLEWVLHATHGIALRRHEARTRDKTMAIEEEK